MQSGSLNVALQIHFLVVIHFYSVFFFVTYFVIIFFNQRKEQGERTFRDHLHFAKEKKKVVNGFPVI